MLGSYMIGFYLGRFFAGALIGGGIPFIIFAVKNNGDLVSLDYLFADWLDSYIQSPRLLLGYCSSSAPSKPIITGSDAG